MRRRSEWGPTFTKRTSKDQKGALMGRVTWAIPSHQIFTKGGGNWGEGGDCSAESESGANLGERGRRHGSEHSSREAINSLKGGRMRRFDMGAKVTSRFKDFSVNQTKGDSSRGNLPSQEPDPSHISSNSSRWVVNL